MLDPLLINLCVIPHSAHSYLIYAPATAPMQKPLPRVLQNS